MRTYAAYAIAVVVVLGSSLAAQAPEQLHNWPAPLYWQPTAADHQRGVQPEGRSAKGVTPGNPATIAPTPAIFVAITPCRVVDTRPEQGFPSPWGQPALAGYSQRNFEIPSSPKCTGLPSAPVAWSLNFTVVPLGPLGFLSVWPEGGNYPGVSTLNSPNGAIIANAAIAPAGLNGGITVAAGNPTHLIIDINGYYVTQGSITGSTTAWNTALGFEALKDSLPGTGGNTAIGSHAMEASASGSNNTAVGMAALSSNYTGEGNVGVGTYSLRVHSSGDNNVAVGLFALTSLTWGSDNTAVGANALWSVSEYSSGNVALGKDALVNSPKGSGNVAIGLRAGQNLRYGDANIYIGQDSGIGDTIGDESATTRIGSTQTRAFVTGIRSTTTGAADAIPVVIDSNGQLGTVSSSRRVKRDIDDLGDTTDTILALHPVRFRYTAHGPGSPLQYGLIAEEVAEIAPDLVARNKDGEIETVFYDKVNAMLLNEVQKLHRERDAQAKAMDAQKAAMDAQTAVVKVLESRLADLEARIK